MRIIVFSDLDGTLLDHDTYDFSPALPAIAALKRCGGLLVLASSKTAAEMQPLHRALDLGTAPMIVENGAACVSPDPATPPLGQPAALDRDYRAIRRVLAELKAPFRGFGDMTPEEIAQRTGLSPEAAQDAAQRQFSEPGIWQGDAQQREAFIAALARHGLQARQGGRFLTLSFGATKADQMKEVISRLGPARTITLGDAPNDVEMLALADQGVVVRNDHGPALPAFQSARPPIFTQLSGPAGWNAAVEQILSEWTPSEGAAADG